MSEGNGTTPSKAAIDLAVHAIAEQDQFIVDGKLDMTKLRERIFAVISREKVLAKKERAEKATRRARLLATLFPSLPGPDQFDAQPDPVLARFVYQAIDKKVWDETKSSADGPVQRLVGISMGNGYVMCRTKIGREQAIYITDNIDCIREDFTRPENLTIDNKLAMATRNREMLVLRQPQNAAKYASEYKRTLNSAVLAAGSQMELAVEAATSNHAGGEDEAGDE